MARKNSRLEEKMRLFETSCREHDLKITPQRAGIFKELISTYEHPSAVTLYEKVKKVYPNISLDTVNRTLLTFHKIGLARLVEGSGDPKRFDGNPEPHHHFRCVNCGKILDVFSDRYGDIEIPAKIRERCVVLTAVVRFEGYCDTCKGAED
jgi:Fur family peroxide stress response transcriptional regulator